MSAEGITNLTSLTLSENLVVGGTETITGGVTYAGSVALGDTSADAITINGTTTALAPITIGVNGTGHDVKWYGDTTNKFMVWDQSADKLILTDSTPLQLGGEEGIADGFTFSFDGTNTLAINALTANDQLVVGGTTSTDVTLTSAAGTITLDASANTLAVTTINSMFNGTLTVGVNDTGYDVQFFGATAGKSLLWDESADSLILTSASATALVAGANGSTNPALQVDASTASSATGIKIKSADAGGGIAISALSSNANENVTIDAKGTGTITIAGTSSGGVTITRVLTVSNGIMETATTRTPAADNGPNTIINAGITAVDVAAPVNGANDWITLPSLSTVPDSHTIRIACTGGSNFELRTPATSGELINNVDSDGTQEYLCTDTDLIIVTKMSNTQGWVAQSITNLGAVRTAVVPD